MLRRRIWMAVGLVVALGVGGMVGQAVGERPWVPRITGQVSLDALHQRIQGERVHGRLLIEAGGARYLAPDGQVLRVSDFAERIHAAELDYYRRTGVRVIGVAQLVLKPGIGDGWQRGLAVAWQLAGQGFWVLLYGAMALLLVLSLRQFAGVGASRFARVRPGSLRLDAVAGQAGPKQELAEIIDYLKDPTRFASLGARAPRGVLLYGPPGNGKTLLAKAIAGEARATFLEQNAASFVQLYVGAGAMAVRRLFREARKQAPCVIFIDEIDAVGGARSGGNGTHDERLQTLNALLAEMDGMNDNAGLVVIAATNRLDSLDAALIRPGRFDRKVLVPSPGRADRQAILAHYLAQLPRHALDAEQMARQAAGFSGAELAAWVNEAAIEAAREGAQMVQPAHADRARDRILMGPLNHGMTLDAAARRTTAYHEAGHALIQHRLRPGAVDRVSIRPRGQALGVTIMHQDEDRLTPTRADLEQDLRVLLAGRAAEEVSGQPVSSGAASDLERASQIAVQALTRLGLGQFGAFVPQHEQLQLEAEREAAAWLNAIYAAVREELAAARPDLDAIANALLADEELDGHAFTAVLDRAA